MAEHRSRPTERPAAERSATAKPRPAAVRARRRADLWGPVRGGIALTAVAWPVRWLLDSSLGPGLVGWLWLVWGAVWGVAAAVLARHIAHPQERHAAGLVLALAGLWCHAVWWSWSTWGNLQAFLGVGVILAVGAQALNQREWDRGKLAADRDAWPELMHGTVWADTHPLGPAEDLAPGVRRRRFRRHEATDTSIGDLTDPKARTRYEERHHLAHGSVRVERDGKSVDDVVVTEVTRDPQGGRGVAWDTRVLTHIWEELVLGYYEDGQPELVQPWRPGVGPTHMLIAGVTGSGKSTLARLLAACIAPAREAVTHMLDCKGGQSFGRLGALFSWFTYDPDKAVDHLEALVDLMLERQHIARQRGWEVWYADADNPVHFVWIDELARLVGMQTADRPLQKRALAALVQLVQQGRSTGFCVIACTQYPTTEAVGSKQFRAQIDWRACFRMAEAGDQASILTRAPRGVEAADIDDHRNGTCYVQSGSRCRSVPLRVLNITDGRDERGRPDPKIDDQITPLVRAWWDRKTPIPDKEITVLDHNGAWSDRAIYTPDGETYVLDPDPQPAPDPDPDPTPEPHLSLVKEPAMTAAPGDVALVDLAAAHTPTPEQARLDTAAAARIGTPLDDTDTPAARDAAWALIVAAGHDGLSPADVYKHPTVLRSPSWAYKRFAAWRENGHLIQIEQGRHRAANRHLD